MNEGDYLEMVNQLKIKFDENERKVKIVMESNIQLKKHIMACYGLSKMVHILDDSIDQQEREFIFSTLRSYLSDVIEQDILCCPQVRVTV